MFKGLGDLPPMQFALLLRSSNYHVVLCNKPLIWSLEGPDRNVSATDLACSQLKLGHCWAGRFTNYLSLTHKVTAAGLQWLMVLVRLRSDCGKLSTFDQKWKSNVLYRREDAMHQQSKKKLETNLQRMR